MNHKNHITVVLTAFIAGALLFNARADITTGLVGYWALDDGPPSSTTGDSSTNNNAGTLTGFSDTNFTSMWTTTTDPTNGQPYAMAFNTNGDTGDYVSVPDIAPLDIGATTKDVTVAAWVNAGAAASTEGAILCKGTGGGGESYCMDVTSSKFRVFVRNASGGTSLALQATVGPTQGVWFHVVGTYTIDSKLIIYINGVSNNSVASTFTGMVNSNHVVSIGNRQSSTGPYNLPWFGLIDEVRIYNRALSASDVLQLYQTKAFSLVNSNVGYWNGAASSTLDNTSLNFCTNLNTAPLGTASSLANLLTVEANNSLPLGGVFADYYYNNGLPITVTATNLSIAAGGVAMGTASGPGTMTFLNTGFTYTLNSSDSIGLMDGANPTSLAQSGTGTVILTGTNTFSGGVTINDGAVQVGNGGAVSGQELGTATTVTDNGTLAFDGNNNLNFGLTISGGGSVTQKGTGTLTLSGANTYTNTTTIANSTLKVSSMADGTSSIGTSVVNFNTGSLLYTGSGDSTARQVNGTTGTTNTIDVPSGVNLELSGRVTGGGTWFINKNDTGTLTLSGTGDNSFLAANVNAGTLVLNKASSSSPSVHGLGEASTVNNGGTLQLSGSGGAEINTVALTVNSGGVFDLNSQNNSLTSLSLAGVGNSSDSDGGALINSAANTTPTLTSPITLAANTTIGGAGNITLPDPVGGIGSLTYVGSGMLTLAGTNAYTGGTFVSSGTLDGNAIGSLPSIVTVSGTGILQMDSVSAMSPVGTLILPASPAVNIVNLNYGGTQNIGTLIMGGTQMPAGTYGQGALNPSGVFTGSGLLNVVETYWDANGTDASSGTNTAGGGSGSWDSGTPDWWAGGNVDTAWTANNVAFFAGSPGIVTLNASETVVGMVFSSAGYTITNTDGVSTLALGGNNPIVSVPSGTTAIGCDLTGGGASEGLTVSGPGTLVLTGTNTYGNGTLVTGGATLSVNAISDIGNSAIGTSGNITLSGGTISYTGSAGGTTARPISGTGTSLSTIDVPVTAGTLTLNGAVEGTAMSKTSGGELILGGSVDNSGLNMAINGGLVIIEKASSSTVHGLGGGASSVGSGAELQLSGIGGFDLYSGCILTVNSGGVLDVDGQSDSFSTLTLSGTGAGSGVLINSAGASGLTNGGSGVVLAGPTTIGGPGSILLASGISGTGPLTYSGGATLTLGGAGTYSAGTIINAGNTVQLNNQSGAGTGTISMSGASILTLSVAGTYSNAITGGSTSVVNATLPAGNTFITGALNNFTGTINCETATTTGQLVINNSNNFAFPINSAATWNIANGATLDLATPYVLDAANVIINGVGNNQAYGAFRLDSCNQTGPVLLNSSNSTIGDFNTNAPSTISGVISDGGHGYGFSFVGNTPVTLVLAATNTYSGATTVSNGTLAVGGAGCLGGVSGNYAANIAIVSGATFNYGSSLPQTLSGVVSGAGVLAQSGPGKLTLAQTNIYSGATLITNGSTLMVGGAGSLGAAGASNNYAGSIGIYGTLNYASSAAQTLSGVISGTGAVTESGPGTLTLSGTDSYSGATTVSSGATLTLSSSGSINNSTSLNLAAGAIFDVSAYGLSYSMGGTTTLRPSGTGTNVGTTAATVKGGASGTVNVGSLALIYTPTSFSGDTNHPALFISQGTFDLSASSITVSNAAGTPLGVGTYSLVQVASSNLSAATTSVTVTGTGLAAGTAATLGINGGSLNLLVAVSGPSEPGINSVSVSGGNIVFSGTNGPANGTYIVLTSTNAALHLSSWTPIATNTFSGTGTFSVTNAISGSQRFYAIEIP